MALGALEKMNYPMAEPMTPMRTVTCPRCGVPVAWTSASKWRPFCSERCKLVDLGAWASDRYVIAGGALDDTSSDALERDDRSPGR